MHIVQFGSLLEHLFAVVQSGCLPKRSFKGWASREAWGDSYEGAERHRCRVVLNLARSGRC
jgi:hypothetical protein